MKTIGIVLFDDAEELDVVGPYEVFGYAAGMRDDLFRVCTIAERDGTVRCAKGLAIVPSHSFATAPDLDIIVVPGGRGTLAQLENPAMLAWIARQASRCDWVASVCTGTRLLLAAGPAVGKRVTTHWRAVPELREQGRAAAVLDDVRFVRDGNLVTSAGVSAGIDMALWLVGQITEPDFARAVQKGIEYFPAPPYTAAA
jgi:transcriptional regulator GlxA family with amidase domain